MVLLIYGIIIDFYGRKPAIVTTIFILGIWILFFGQFKPLWYDAFVNYTLPFVIVGGIMCSGCIVGDFSNFYRRGRILGTILFSSLISLFIGYLSGLGLIFLAQQSEIIDLVQNPVIGHAFNFLSILILSSMVILIFTPETFDNKSIEWRKHLQQLFILTKDGLNLFYYDFLSVPDVKKEDVYDLDFSKREDDLQSTGDNWQKMMDSDLISSSLSGVQMLLKEISQSADNLRVLDHSDRKIFFSHGLQTTLVLFTTDYLPLYHELLAKFQDEFEYYNRDLLGSFVGSIPKWHFLKELMKKYFDINRAP
jgi:MFS family permease